MDLSAVIVNWNSASYLGRLARSLAPLKDELEEIVVVDNASEDSSLQVLGSHPEIRILSFDRNHGFARAANAGISGTHASFILLLNPDVEVEPRSIRRLYQRIRERPHAAIVCGPVVNKNGTRQSFQIRAFPTWRSVLSDALFFDEFAQWFRGSSVDDFSKPVTTDSGVEIEQPAAAFWVLRKKAWESIGGFDPEFYPAWFEDVDFCKRLHEADWRILYFPDAPVTHKGGVTLERLGHRVFVDIYHENLLRYLRKHQPCSYPLLWFPVKWGAWVRKHFLQK